MRDPLWPQLPTSTPTEVEQRRAGSLAQAMYGPRPQTKPTNPHRESLLRGLRELNARIDARRREGRR